MRLQGNWLITGGSGFLGRALIARAEEENWPCDFTIFSRDEQKQDAVRNRWPHVRCILGDVCDHERLTLAMYGHTGVLHAGALKYIPEAEFNASECVRVNLMGSQTVIAAARQAGVEACIAISTDKAVMPLNVYGATKMLMERAFVEADIQEAPRDGTRFGVVRYGNVIGSTGSIIPVLIKSASLKGFVNVTDPGMTRFWLTVDEAIDLILTNADMLAHQGMGVGEIMVQEARAMRLGDLIDTVIPSSIERKIIGRRPGEKMDECLVSAYEALKVTDVSSPYVRFSPLGKSTPDVYEEYSSSAPMDWLEPSALEEAIEQAATV